MFLRNYDNLITVQNLFFTKADIIPEEETGSFGEGTLFLKDIEGVSCRQKRSDYAYSPFQGFRDSTSLEDFLEKTYYSGDNYLWCGDGEENPHYDDYHLGNSFTRDQLSSITGSDAFEYLYNQEENSITCNYTRTFMAKEKIDVREIGLFFNYDYAILPGETSSRPRNFLLFKDKLPEIIDLNVGDFFKITVSIIMYTNPHRPIDYTEQVNLAIERGESNE
jgi:hypothetical protein